jgi:hypothetical protein
MAISKLGGSTSDNWELISSVTPTAASAAVNFTGLNPYRKLLLIWDDTTLGSDGSVSVRLNNDSSSNYAYTFVGYSSGTGVYSNTVSIFGTAIACSTSGTNPTGAMEFANCDTTGLKTITNGFVDGTGSGTAPKNQYSGYYKASAVISQVNLITSTTFNAAGTVYLYGVK